MRSFINFIALHGKNYKDQTETARKYVNYKANYQEVVTSKRHDAHLPHKLTADSPFADLSGAEFLQLIGKAPIVPLSVESNDGKNAFSFRPEVVPIIDKINGDLPSYKNWYEEGIIAASRN